MLTTLQTAFAVTTAGFTAFGALALFRLRATTLWLTRDDRRENQRTKRSKRKIWILLPAKNEQRRLPGTIAYFQKTLRSHDARIVIITTATEKEIAKTLSTRQIAQRLAHADHRITHMHYKGTGVMAHQLNFALTKLHIGTDDIIGLYNADSHPDQRTFDWILQQPTHRIQVFQQYGDYTRNIQLLREARGAPILVAAAAWQSRWSLTFEIPHARLQPISRSDGIAPPLLYPMNYCIGHGLFFTREVYDRVGGFSEQTHNEDAIFGLQLNLRNIAIEPIPHFDSCDTVDNVRGLLQQQKNWYFGPLQANKYRALIIEHEETMPRRDTVRLWILVAQLFSHAVYWIVGPTLFAFMILYATLSRSSIVIACALIAYLIYLPIANIAALRATGTKVNGKDAILLMGGSAVNYLIHGIAAYWALLTWSHSKLLRKPIPKDRTPMRDDGVQRGATA
jgi:cellulose synthase/poly-beta-1,6-N-acetylglucosamine synthase-like glycosyltransferase